MKTTLGTALCICSASTLLLGACTSLPKMQIPYYLPKTEVPIKVTRVIACSGDSTDSKREIYEVISVHDVIPKYSADTAALRYFNTEKHDHRLSDSSISFDFHDDGRLSSVNASGTGKGMETIKAVAGVISPILGARSLRNGDSGSLPADRKKAVKEACEHIDASATATTPDGRPRQLMLTYESSVLLQRGEPPEILRPAIDLNHSLPSDCANIKYSRQALSPSLGSVIDHCRVRDALGDLHLHIADADKPQRVWSRVTAVPACEAKTEGTGNNACKSSSNTLYAVDPASRKISILSCPVEIAEDAMALASATRELERAVDAQRSAQTATPPATGAEASPSAADLQARVDAARSAVQQASEKQRTSRYCRPDANTLTFVTIQDSAHGNEIEIPVPQPKAFGGSDFKLVLADSGGIKQLEYKKTASGDAVAESVGSLVDLARGPTAADEAAALNAEADRIAALQRLAQCKADPANCK